jgi:hypothetical protein
MLVQDTEAEPPAIRFASFLPMPRDHRDTFVHDRLCFVAQKEGRSAVRLRDQERLV